MIIPKNELRKELCERIIPFWRSLRDDNNGGYYGWGGFFLNVREDAVKGGILNSRILWFFSSVYSLLGDEALLGDARHAYAFLRDRFIDRENGGIFWSVDAQGNPVDGSKHTYNLSFAIYGLCAYYTASGDEQALKLALELFELVEKRCADSVGYIECFSRAWERSENDKLSENGILATRTMNTLLHVMEAYTSLLAASGQETVRQRLIWIIDVILTKIYNPERERLDVFFDDGMNSLLDIHSYGHDIEAAWLLDRACEVAGDDALTARVRGVAQILEDKILSVALTDSGLLNECVNSVVNTWRVWWVQAEGIVGFCNAWQKRRERDDFARAARSLWEYVKESVIDRRSGGEWFWRVSEFDLPDGQSPVVEPWKCPYHNGRMCIELLTRKELCQ